MRDKTALDGVAVNGQGHIQWMAEGCFGGMLLDR